MYVTNNWQTTAADQIAKMVFSGLYDEADLILCCVSAPDAETADVASEFFKLYGPKVAVFLHEPGSPRYERDTLMLMRNMSSPSDNILYLHSKGVTVAEQYAFKVYLWRNMMEFFLVRHWKACVEYLKEYDVVGALHS